MSDFNPVELHRTFEASDYGQTLAQRTRFNVFKPEWASTELWTGLLGDDVSNLDHMPHTYGITKTFCNYEGMGEKDTNRLLVTAITHDWGEAIIGDIPLPDKTHNDEVNEKVAYAQVAYDGLGAVLGGRLVNTVWPVLSHEEEDLADRFRAIEYIGYCTTAMRAGQVATRLVHGLQKAPVSRAEKDQLVSGLLGLERAVTVGNFPTLKAYVEKYPSIEDQLKEIH
jgi:hypothetical protein